MSRWATFDCYGTLIDWNGGIGGVLEGLFGAERARELLARYHRLEPEVQAEEYRSYAEVLTLTLERLASENDLALPEGESGVLARSLPEWPVFREVPAALAELRRRGWKLAILSNTDRAFIVESEKRIGVPFDLIVTAEDVNSYKPAHAHWERFFELDDGRSRAPRARGREPLPRRGAGTGARTETVWINRLGEAADPEPDRELPDLSGLPDTLDELVPA